MEGSLRCSLSSKSRSERHSSVQNLRLAPNDSSTFAMMPKTTDSQDFKSQISVPTLCRYRCSPLQGGGSNSNGSFKLFDNEI